jgi:hypothetical protein
MRQAFLSVPREGRTLPSYGKGESLQHSGFLEAKKTKPPQKTLLADGSGFLAERREKMTDLQTGETEKQKRDLQKELVEVGKDRAALRLQPSLADSEILEKDRKLEELNTRAKTIDRIPQDIQRKRQGMMAESILKGSSDSHL